jgi:hypothetical protein
MIHEELVKRCAAGGKNSWPCKHEDFKITEEEALMATPSPDDREASLELMAQLWAKFVRIRGEVATLNSAHERDSCKQRYENEFERLNALLDSRTQENRELRRTFWEAREVQNERIIKLLAKIEVLEMEDEEYSDDEGKDEEEGQVFEVRADDGPSTPKSSKSRTCPPAPKKGARSRLDTTSFFSTGDHKVGQVSVARRLDFAKDELAGCQAKLAATMQREQELIAQLADKTEQMLLAKKEYREVVADLTREIEDADDACRKACEDEHAKQVELDACKDELERLADLVETLEIRLSNAHADHQCTKDQLTEVKDELGAELTIQDDLMKSKLRVAEQIEQLCGMVGTSNMQAVTRFEADGPAKLVRDLVLYATKLNSKTIDLSKTVDKVYLVLSHAEDSTTLEALDTGSITAHAVRDTLLDVLRAKEDAEERMQELEFKLAQQCEADVLDQEWVEVGDPEWVDKAISMRERNKARFDAATGMAKDQMNQRQLHLKLSANSQYGPPLLDQPDADGKFHMVLRAKERPIKCNADLGKILLETMARGPEMSPQECLIAGIKDKLDEDGDFEDNEE